MVENENNEKEVQENNPEVSETTDNVNVENEKVESKTFTAEEVEQKLEEQRQRSSALIDRVAKREAKKAREKALQENQGTQQNYNNNFNAPASSDQKWDPVIGWIPKEMSQEEYSSFLQNYLSQQGSGTSNYEKQGQPSQATSASIPSNVGTNNNSAYTGMGRNQQAEDINPEAQQQYFGLALKYKDVDAILGSSAATILMANSAAQDPRGFENLYILQKNDPSKLFQISQMTPDKQRYAMWELNKQMAQNRQKKVKTTANEQPPPLTERGTVNKLRSEMSYAEKKRQDERKIWGD